MSVYICPCGCGATGSSAGTSHGQPMTASTSPAPVLSANGSAVALTRRGPKR